MINFLINAIKIIFLLGFLVLIHEGGHFLVARLCKVKVNEFAIGFGKTIWSKQGKETKYALRLIPFGGFVSMEGEEERSKNPGSYSEKSILQRIAIVAAGGLTNIIFALVIYFLLSAISGNYVSMKVSGLIDGYGAEQAGIQIGDKILKVNDKKIRLKSDLDDILQKSNGEKVKILVERNGEEQEIEVTPVKEEYEDTEIYLYYLGINLTPAEKTFTNQLYYGFLNTTKFTSSIVENLKTIFTGKMTTDQLTGPIGISKIVSDTKGIEEYIYIIAVISLSLGVTNLLPFPPLDGGKIVLLIIEGIRRKPLKENVEIQIQMIGFALIIALSLYVSYKDVLRIF